MKHKVTRNMSLKKSLTAQCMTNKQTTIKFRPLLPRFVEKLPRKRKYLGAFISNHISPEFDQHIS